MPHVIGIDTALATLYERASLTANGVPAWSFDAFARLDRQRPFPNDLDMWRRAIDEE
jgi:hypothetical protein